MRFLVTGGSGFIGSHLVEALLDHGAERIIVLDRWLAKELAPFQTKASFEYVNGDIRDRQLLKHLCRGVDVVYHLASVLGTSESIEIYDPAEVAEINVVGTLSVLQASRAANVKKVIYPSTPDVPWLNPYKITKRACEDFCRMFYQEYGLRTVVLRLTNVYGPRERWLGCDWGAPYNYQKVVPTFIVRALKNEPLPVFGDGEQEGVYVYVKDVVEALLLAATRDECDGKIVPIGSTAKLSVKNLALLILKLTNSESPLEFHPMRRGEIKVSIDVDLSLAEQYLGFKAKTPLVEGLQATIAFYRKKLSEAETSGAC
jgi:nucleoside-diphosphate-sugar epimerase